MTNLETSLKGWREREAEKGLKRLPAHPSPTTTYLSSSGLSGGLGIADSVLDIPSKQPKTQQTVA